MNKKAIEIQFNWIFVLVAGAAILLFFTVIIAKQKNISDISTKTTVLKSIEAIIAGASVTTDTTKIDDIPESSIEVSCGRVSIGGVSKQYQNLILFAPNLIKGNRLIWQTAAFSVPYKATNLLFMTSARARYIIIADDSDNIAREINKLLPSDLVKEFYKPTQASTIRNENNYKVKFIYFFMDPENSVLSPFKDLPDSDVTAIKVTGDLDKGEIEFFEKKGQSWDSKGTSSYITKSSLLGAVYTGALETYECSMRNVFARLNIVTSVYIDKTQELETSHPPPSNCYTPYLSSLSYLGNIRSSSNNLAKSENFAEQDIVAITSAKSTLSAKNKILQENSCPLIY